MVMKQRELAVGCRPLPITLDDWPGQKNEKQSMEKQEYEN